ncbi:fibronectin type III domain-containing protein [Micromonospora zhanjiangensis]|uniref:Fibronectin type-III domain-containing protein n=1 Tax=Micromonospora zhanjiangensis TaxID=1522057 RepID=A0ABV8KEM7_9ACTN
MSDRLARIPTGRPPDVDRDPVVRLLPDVPTGLVATPACGTPTVPPAIVLVWTNHGDPATPAVRNRLERSADPSFATGLTSMVLPGAISRHTDGDVLPNTTYHYRVRAEYPTGHSAWSNLAPGCVPLLAPVRLTALVPQVGPPRLFWTNRSFADGVELQRATNPTFSSGLVTLALPTCATWTDPTVGPETTYYYRVRTGYLGTFSPWSTLAVVSTRR